MIVASTHQNALILGIPLDNLDLVLMYLIKLAFALQIIQVPYSNSFVLRARGQVLLLNGIKGETHDSLSMCADIFIPLVLSCLELLALFNGAKKGSWLNCLRIKVPYLNFGKECSHNDVIGLLPLPVAHPLKAERIGAEQDLVMDIKVTGLVVIEVNF